MSTGVVGERERWGLRLLGRLPCLHRRIVQIEDQGPPRTAGLLLEDDAAVRIQSGRTLESRTLWATTLVASDGRVNVPIERGSFESDEETFMDRMDGVYTLSGGRAE